MKCNGIKFVYRGTDHTGLGQALASLLEEISVEYNIDSVNPKADSTHISADLGALLRTLDAKVISRRKQSILGRDTTPYGRANLWLRSHGFDPHHISDAGGDNLAETLSKTKLFKDEPLTTTTSVPTVFVRDRCVLQWLQSMNIPTGKPITLQFMDDLIDPDGGNL